MKSRLGRPVAAPPMTVRRHVPVGVRAAIGCVALGLAVLGGLALGRTMFVQAWLGDADPRLGRLVDENRALRDERERLVESGNTTDSRRAMERSTIRELGEQIARLEADNGRLKEDVAFFEAATADRPRTVAGDATGGIAIRRFQVTQDRAAHVARYRLLLTQDSKANRDFTGDLQLAIGLLQGARAIEIVLPATDADGAAAGLATQDGQPANFALSFRSYKRIDGSFAVPAGSVLRSVQARILEHGAIRLRQTVTLD